MNPLNIILGPINSRLQRLGLWGTKSLKPTESTLRQNQDTPYGVDYAARLALLTQEGGELAKSDTETLPATYETWRLMSRNPTLALAKAVATGPILAASWSYEARDKAVPDAWVAFARSMLEPLREPYLEDAVRSMEFGWAPFEVVWKLVSNSQADGLPSVRWEIERFKPLLPELTEPVFAPITGQYLGIRNGTCVLPLGKSVVYTYDSLAGNVYGMPRHENVREEYCEYQTLRRHRLALIRKVSGVIPIIRYLRGKSIDPATGKPVENYVLAKRLLGVLAQSRGVTFESAAIDSDDLRGNPELLKLANFSIDAVDVGSSGQSIAPMIAHAQYIDGLLMRGWLQPERSALQGQHGTNAEAETHAKVGVTDSERVHRQMVRPVQQALDVAMELNFGAEARGAVLISPAPLVDAKRRVMEQLYEAMLKNPGLLELILAEIDRDQVYDRLELPKLEQVAGSTSRTPGTPASGTDQPAIPPSASDALNRLAADTDPSATPGASPASPAPAAPSEGLNGAQSASAVDILLRVRTGELMPVAATELLVSIGMKPDAAERSIKAQTEAGRLPSPSTNPPGTAAAPPTPSPADQPPTNTPPAAGTTSGGDA